MPGRASGDLGDRLAVEGGVRSFLERRPLVAWEALAAPIGVMPVALLAHAQREAARDGWLGWFARDALARAVHEWLPRGWDVGDDADVHIAQALADWITTMGQLGEAQREVARRQAERLRRLRPPRGWKPSGPEDPILVGLDEVGRERHQDGGLAGSALERVPKQIRARIQALAVGDPEAWAARPVPALGNQTIEDALRADDGLARVAEYLAKVEAVVGRRAPDESG